MKFVVFGGFLILSGVILLATAAMIHGSSVISFIAMAIGLVISVYGLFSKEK